MPHETITHEYVKKYPIKDFFTNSEKPRALILGTFYPCKCKHEDINVKNNPHLDFNCNFYYGNNYSIWKILRTSFNLRIEEKRNINYKTRNESAEKIVNLLKANNVAISDIIKKAKRNDNAACSADNFSNKTEYNIALLDAIKENYISKIYFTSEKTLKLFNSKVYALAKCGKLPISEVKSGIDSNINENNSLTNLKVGKTFTVSAENSYFDHDINCIILPSPSNRANGCNVYNQESKEKTFSEWRTDFYTNAFKDVFTKS